MSDLTTLEKHKLEKLLGMGNGYVLNFTDRTFQDFVLEHTEIDILSEKYKLHSGSKANRLRKFWDIESNNTIGHLTAALIQHWVDRKLITEDEITAQEKDLSEDCLRIVARLKQDTPVENIDAIKANNDDKDFALLAKLIRDSIEKGEPETALDRLHTFVVKYVRELCNKHKVHFNTSESLNSIFGKYVKHIIGQNLIQSTMTEKILKFSIQIMDAFNDVRNNRSFAHDNPILNYHESVLIFNNISSSIKFIDTIEKHIVSQQEEVSLEWQEFKV
jgi:hypothetical protein